MSWDFETEPEFQEQLDWTRAFLDEHILPLETIELEVTDEQWKTLTAPLKQQVKDRGLWACHLDPELGGQGFGQVKLGLMHEILGRSSIAPAIFGNNAPDSGNAELLAIGGNEEQKKKWMEPLLAGELRSGFSMTEPDTAGSDPTLLETNAVRDGDTWVINGHKWFTSGGSGADFLIAMVVTNPDVHPYQGSSMIVVPTDTPGLEIVRDVPNMHHPYPGQFARHPIGHSEVIYRDVRVPAENLIGEPGDGFVLAQKRLGPGRIHHAMRWIGQSQRALDMMCERALSRFAHGSLLAEKQMVQDFIAETRIDIASARLLCLHAAWHMDKHGSSASRTEIAMIKVYGTKMLFNAIDRSIQVHGALGYSADMPLEEMYRNARASRLVDGADEVHKVSIARRTLKEYAAVDGFPTEHIPTRRAAALDRFAEHLDIEAMNS
ncbi:MAG: acyl-CoA dehydrogenase [Acidimicrobiia bacterium]|nr:acyl-CoA dehydrogenase [Acidimicrobiia bacterium]MXZ85526.1 acyl-CoA dehydrogenase [Acidimicrobiia bacterium]MYB73282.1 acyl-CoA dehydrogenase [Acidimicrobiia bacterium]MYG71915.1 acyl-CoA dehydrogenase [Acidimicrobiia bacterium]MYH97555.1 acyl-CoA dehydrogenase [Acidimicrobiia bacterium]